MPTQFSTKKVGLLTRCHYDIVCVIRSCILRDKFYFRESEKSEHEEYSFEGASKG
jgi:hypothetical protein